MTTDATESERWAILGAEIKALRDDNGRLAGALEVAVSLLERVRGFIPMVRENDGVRAAIDNYAADARAFLDATGDSAK